MSDIALAPPPAAADPPRSKILRIAAWIVGILVILVALRLAGIDVWGWFEQLWDSVTDISVGYVILGCLFQGAQTMLTALGWYGILRYAYPGGVNYTTVLACYATGVALNNVVPANLGTFVTLLMFVAVVSGATFPGILAGYAVQKIFYLVVGTLIYIYLFTAIEGSFEFQFGDERDAISNHPVLTLSIIGGAIFLLALLLRIFWNWVKTMWVKAKSGAAILGDLRRVREVGAAPPGRRLCREGRRDRDLPRCLRNPGHLRLDHERPRLEPAREPHLLHAWRSRREPGVQLLRARELHEHVDRDGVLASANS